MTHKAHIVHHIPGRTRIRVPSKRRDIAYFHEVKRRLQTIDGVQAHVDATTASALIEYPGALSELMEQFAEAGVEELFDLELTPAAAVLPMPVKLVLLAGLMAIGVYRAWV